MFLEGLPSRLNAELARANERTREAITSSEWTRVIEEQQRVYNLLLDAQSEGHRIHKGGPLMSVGSAYLELQRPDEAERWILEAFVEDALSRAEESPATIDELGRPAAMALLFNFGVPGTALVDLAVRLRRRVAHGQLWVTASAALAAEPLGVPEARTVAQASAQARAAIEQVAEASRPVAQWRVPGLFGTRYEERVFVGGSYGPASLGALVNIRDGLRTAGFDGVLAAEFKRPRRTPETDYADALLLLRSSKWAVFEVSERSGQLHELQDAVSSGFRGRVLMLRASASDRPSAMTAGAARQLGTRVLTYAGPSELQELVRSWIRRRARSRA